MRILDKFYEYLGIDESIEKEGEIELFTNIPNDGNEEKHFKLLIIEIKTPTLTIN